VSFYQKSSAAPQPKGQKKPQCRLAAEVSKQGKVKERETSEGTKASSKRGGRAKEYLSAKGKVGVRRYAWKEEIGAAGGIFEGTLAKESQGKGKEIFGGSPVPGT